MAVTRRETMAIREEHDVVQVRSAVRRWAQELGFTLIDQTKLVTAASELARNTLVHGEGGEMTLESVEEHPRLGLRLIFADQGPGIPDIAKALTDGYSTGQGMGLGLGGAKRLTNEFEIISKPGEGTRVTVCRWKQVF
jgi:serine/threonine-protein kinase RsbT